MRPNWTHPGATKAVRPGLFAAVLFCATLTGCENYCFVVVSNPGGTVSGAGATCPVTKPTGHVSLRFGSQPTAFDPLRVAHIFVTLRGIEALPATTAGEDPPDWQELAPQLAARPLQVDILSQAGDSCGSGPLDATAVPADVYSQIRLRIVPNPIPNKTATSEPTPEANACGPVVFSCLVTPDAAVRPLVWDDPAELRVSSERIARGFFWVLPDSEVHLAIELDPRSLVVLASGDALRLVPTFSVSEQSPCESAALQRPAIRPGP